MSDSGYTPTDDEVREAFALSGEGLDFKRVAIERMAAFDSWLAAHDAEVAAKAWDEGQAAMKFELVYEGLNVKGRTHSTMNPYRDQIGENK